MRKVLAVIVFFIIFIGILSLFDYITYNYRPIPFNYKSPPQCLENGICLAVTPPPKPSWAPLADTLIEYIVAITVATVISRAIWIGKKTS